MSQKSLSDFVSETLQQILTGIRNAQRMDDGDHVSPKGIRLGADHAPKKYLETQTGHMVMMIDFDVAVTATEGSTAEGGMGIAVLPLKLGAKASTGSENLAENRIRFSVPFAMPAAEFDIGYRPKDGGN